MAKQESTLRPGDNGASSEDSSSFSLEYGNGASNSSGPNSSGPNSSGPAQLDDATQASDSSSSANTALSDADASSHISLTDQDLSDLAARNVSGFEVTTGSNMQAGSEAGADVAIIASFDARDGDSVSLPDISYIYDADYVRQGSDLLLIKPDGTAIQIENYFAVEITPDILGFGGRRLTPELVESFLHPVAPNQLAALTDNQVAQAQGTSIGSVETITGEVYAVRPDGTRVRLQAGDPVFQGDQIQTADGASIKMTFIDGTLFTLGGDARLALDEMVFDPASSSGESAFSILQGGFLFVSGQIAQNNPNDMTVTTPVATIGIRGTIVTGEVSGDQLSTGETFRFTVVDGEIAVTAGTQTIVLSDNFATATGTADAAGGTSMFNFIDTAQNVIARNSSQFKALTPEDLRVIENAIKTTVLGKTGESINLDLQDLVTNAPDNRIDSDTDDEEDDGNSSGDGEESGGDDEEAQNNSEAGETDDGGGEDSGLSEEDLQDLEDSGESDEEEGGGDDGEEDQEEIGDVDVGDGTGEDDSNSPEGDGESNVIDVTGQYQDSGGSDDDSTGGDNSIPPPGQTIVTTQSPVFSQDDTFQESFIPATTQDTSSGGDSSQSNSGPRSITIGQNQLQSSPSAGFDFGYQDPNSTDNTTFDTSNFSNPNANYLVSTGSGTDTVTTGSGNDSVSTGAGNDTIKTGDGDDTVDGGSGDDTIVGGTGEGNDFYDGGTGFDTVTYDSVSGNNTTSLDVSLSTVAGTTTIDDNEAGIIDSDTLTNVDAIRLGHGDDKVEVLAAGINVDGSDGRDTLTLGNAKTSNTFSFADGVYTNDGASSTFTNFEVVEGGTGNDRFTVTQLNQSADGKSGTDTLVIGPNSGLGLVLASSLSNINLIKDGDNSQDYSNFEVVEQDGGTMVMSNGTYTATGQTQFERFEISSGDSVSLEGSGTFVTSGTLTLSSFSELSLKGNLDMRNGTFGVPSSSTEMQIDAGGRLIIGTDTNYIPGGLVIGQGQGGGSLSALTIDVASGAAVEIAQGETASLDIVTYRFASEGSTLAVNGTWSNGSNDDYTGFGDSSASSTITGTGTIRNAGNLTFSGDVLNVDVLNKSATSLAPGTISVNGSGSFTVNSDIDGGIITLENNAELNGTGALTDLATLNLKDASVLDITSAEVTGTVSLSGTGNVSGALNIDDGALSFFNTTSTLSVLSGGSLIVGTDTDLGTDGTVDVTNGATLAIASGEQFDYNLSSTLSTVLNLANGATIGGSGTYVVSDAETMDGVTLQVGSHIDNNSILTVGANGFDIKGDVDNSGGTIAIGSTSTLTVSGGTVALNGAIDMNGEGEIAGASATDTLQLDGTITSNAAGGTNVISADMVVGSSGSIIIGGDSNSDGTLLITGAFRNDGFVQVDPTNVNENGVLKISQDFTNNGTMQIDNAATMVVDDRNGTLINNGTLQGQSSGIFESGVIKAHRIINNGELYIPGATEAGARLTIQGGNFDSLNGKIKIEEGGQLAFNGSTLSVGSDTDYTNAGSMIIQSGGVLDLGASFQFENSNASTLVLDDGASVGGEGTLLNYGTMNLDGVTIDATFENATTEGSIGSLNVASGASLTIHGNLINASDANFTVQDGGTLEGTGNVTNNADLEAGGVTFGSGLTYSGDILLESAAQNQMIVNGTVIGDLSVEANQGPASIGGNGEFEITGGIVNGFDDSLQTSLTIRQSGALTFGSSLTTISVQSDSWIFDSGASFTGSDGTLAFDAGASLGMADGVDFSYDATSMPQILLGVNGGQNQTNTEIFGDATFTVSDGTLVVDNDAVDVTATGFVIDSNLNISDTTMSVSSTNFQNTANGLILVDDGELTVTNGMTNAGTLVLNAQGFSSVLELDKGLSNSGTIFLNVGNGLLGATIDVAGTLSSGSLLNTGLITTSLQGTASVQHLLNVDIDNQGTLNISHDTAFGKSEASEQPTLDTKDGKITIDTDKNLLVRGTLVTGDDSIIGGSGTLTMGDQSAFQVVAGEAFHIGGNNGTLQASSVEFTGQAFINGAGTLTVDANTTFSTLEVSNGANLINNSGNFAGTDFVIDTEGTFKNTNSLSVTDGTFSTAGSLENDGQITVDRGLALMNSAEFDNSGGTLTLLADSDGGATLSVNAAVTNAGTISIGLDGSQSPGFDVVLNSDNGSTLTNSGVLHVEETPQSNSGSLVISSDILNTGDIQLDATASITAGTTLDTKDGDISTFASSELVVGGTLTVGDDTAITGFGSLTFGSLSALNIVSGETFTNTSNTSNMDFTDGSKINGGGNLENLGFFDLKGTSVTLGTVKNDGTLRIDEGASQFSVGTLGGTGTLEIKSYAAVSSTLTLNSDLQNQASHTIELKSSSPGSSLGGEINGSGTLFNAGVLETDTSATAHAIDVDIVNTGLLNIAGQVDVQIGNTINTTSGTIKVTNEDNGPIGKLNFLSGSTLVVGNASVLTDDPTLGSNAGTIDFASNAVLSVEAGETFTVDEGTAVLDFVAGGTIGGTGTFKIGEDVFRNMNGATFTTAALLNEGTIQVGSTHGLRFNTNQVDNSQGLIEVKAFANNVELKIGTDLTLDGDVRLNMGSSGANQATLAVDSGSTLTLTGSLQSTQDSGTGVSNFITGTVVNLGAFDIDKTLTISDNLDTKDGSIDIENGQILSVAGTLTIGSDTALTGTGSIDVGSNGLIDIAATETFSITTLTPNINFATGATLGGLGTLNIASDINYGFSGITLATGEVVNNGALILSGASAAVAGKLSGAGTLSIFANSSENATMVLAGDLTNAADHTISLRASDGTLAQAITLTSQGAETLINAGDLRVDAASQAHLLDVNLQNTGQIVLDGSTSLTAGHHLNSVGGDLSIAAGKTLFADGTLTLGASSVVSASAAEIGGVGSLVISGGVVNLTNTTLSTSNIENNGTIRILGGGLTIDSNNFDNSAGTIDFFSNNSNSTIFFNSDFTNAGNIKIRANSESIIDGVTATVLTNSGMIQFSDGDFQNGENQIKNVSIVNTGTIKQAESDYLRIFQNATVDSANGVLLLADNAVFDIRGGSTLKLGTDTDLTGTGTIDLSSAGGLKMESGENFSYDSTDSTIQVSSSSSIFGAGTFTNQNTFDVTGMSVSSNFVNGTLGILNIGDLASTTGTTITAQSFTNQGELNIIGSNAIEASTNVSFDDFTNTGTINLTSGTLGSSAQMTVGDEGSGTLTNDGLISITGTQASYFGGGTIDGSVEAGTTGGQIFIGSYSASSPTQHSPLTITGDLTLNEKSILTMDLGSGNGALSSHSAALDVGGTLSYGGTFKLLIASDFSEDPQGGSGPVITSGSESGFFQRVQILNQAGTADADMSALTAAGKVLVPDFTGTDFSLSVLSETGSTAGGSGNERLIGSAGGDEFFSGDGGSSVWFGQAGNDKFTLESGASLDFLDGGQGGADVLYLQSTTFASIADNEWRVNNLEALDYTGAAGGNIALTESFAFGASEDSNSLISGLAVDSSLKEDALVIEGNTGQTLDLSSGNWTEENITVSVDHDSNGSTNSYAIYSASNGAHAYVDTDMDVNLGGIQ
jgi:hypothetical protein